MKAKEVYETIQVNSLPLMTAYFDDLIKHDKRDILSSDGNRLFLHFTRAMGTGLLFIDTTGYPLNDTDTIPYLFGHATREHLLKSALDICNHYQTNCRVIQFYDGNTVHTISHDEAEVIVRNFIGETNNKWHGTTIHTS